MAAHLNFPPNVYLSEPLVPNTISLVVFGYPYENPKFLRDLRQVEPVRYSRRYRDLVTEVTIAWPQGSSAVRVMTHETIKPRIFLVSDLGVRELPVSEMGVASGLETVWEVLP